MSMNISGIAQTGFDGAASARPISGAISRRISPWPFVLICALGDFMIVEVTAAFLRPISGHQTALPLINVAAAMALGAACLLAFQQVGLYQIRMLRQGPRAVGRLAICWGFLCLVALASSTFSTKEIQYGHLLWFFVAGLSGFTLERLAIDQSLRHRIRQGDYFHSVAIIGHEANMTAMIGKLDRGFHIHGFWRLPDNAQQIEMSSISSEEQSLLDAIAGEGPDTIIIAMQALAPEKLNALLRNLRRYPVNIYATPQSLSLPETSCNWGRWDEVPDLTLIPLASFPISKLALVAKNVIDRLIALLTLLIVVPVFFICAIGIAISDPGPILFAQKRIGYKGREFQILKFRTMYVTPKPNRELTTRDDPRIFPFGKFLRKTSLDELPQLFNVLAGDMSVVGPRPHMPEASVAGVLYFEAVEDYYARHRVKPGITGWAQVNGWRGPTETIDQIRSRVEFDLYYIENWSLALDFSVMVKTAFSLFGENVF
jgi:Undecaprenyl-phosphate glucose phosphotransferase